MGTTQNIFEEATRNALRFQTNRGLLSTEDMWVLKLEELDAVALGLDKALAETSKSFITTKTSATKETQLKFDVVKHIIDVKLAEKAEKANAKVKAEKKAQLLELLSKKQNAALEAKSEAELLAELQALEG